MNVQDSGGEKSSLMHLENTSFIRLILLRILVMGSNFLSNLFIAKYLLSGEESGFFGLYGIGIALTLFLPVMDLGLGQTVFNFYSKNRFENPNPSVLFFVFKKLIWITAFWILILILIFFGGIFLDGSVIDLNNNIYGFFLYMLTLAIYFISIPFSLGFKVLQSFSRIEIGLLIQSLVSPLILFSILILGKDKKFSSLSVLVIPAAIYLMTCIIAFLLGKKSFEKVQDCEHDIHFKELKIFKLGRWSTLLALSSILLPFSPRIFFQANQQRELLDQYSLFLTFLMPLMSLVSLFALSKNPDFHRLPEEKKFNWLVLNTKKSILLACCVIFLFLTLSPALKIFTLPAISFKSQLVISFILLGYSCYFLPLSAQTDLRTMRKFSIILMVCNAFSFLLMVMHAIGDLNQMIFINFVVPIVVQTIGIWIHSFVKLNLFATHYSND